MKQDVVLSLGSLTQLTQLELQVDLLLKAAVAPFSCLQQLRELVLSGAVSSPDTLLRLPPSLTKLELVWRGEQELSSSLCPDLAALTNLQHLVVTGDSAPGLLPDFCGSMQQLRELRLYKILSPNALPALARSLPALTRLEGLLLHSISELAPPPASAEYSALLPLSLHITSIDMTWWDHGNLLHDGCGQHFLAAGRQLPQLKRLMLGLEDNWDVWDENVRLGALANCTSGVGTCLGEGSLSKLVNCCPGLQQLGIPGLVEPGVQMQPLLQLTALTWLSVGGEVVTDDVACDVLAQLSGLRQ
uniref:Uncharacterized protein n=1 Tax=Tetradesmus obliquus TaxID=3088 RepID=A0A383VJD4_TETOB|eukprot:jgi/Sobl393_1/18584/SZX65321.1